MPARRALALAGRRLGDAVVIPTEDACIAAQWTSVVVAHATLGHRVPNNQTQETDTSRQGLLPPKQTSRATYMRCTGRVPAVKGTCKSGRAQQITDKPKAI